MFLRLGSQRVTFREVRKGGNTGIAMIRYPVVVRVVVPKIVEDETNTLQGNLQPCQIPTLLDMHK
jgi:hypothetical protein